MGGHIWSEIMRARGGEENEAYGLVESEGEIESVNKSFLYLVTQVFLKSSLHSVKIGTENVQGQLYRAYFLRQMEAIVFIILQIFLGMHKICLKISNLGNITPPGNISQL